MPLPVVEEPPHRVELVSTREHLVEPVALPLDARVSVQLRLVAPPLEQQVPEKEELPVLRVLFPAQHAP